jgi:large subunit ribosomal protein L22
MIITATQKNTRQTARKVRYVADVVKKMSIEDALKQLAVMERRASLVILKTLRQAIANAMNNHQLSLDELKIKNIVVDVAPTYKRWRAVSRGRAHTILKRSCHIKVELEKKDSSKKEVVKKMDKSSKKDKEEKKPTKTKKTNKVTKTASKKTSKSKISKKVSSKTKATTKKVSKKSKE